MSALFGKKNYVAVFERLVKNGDIPGALKEAVREGDSLYDLGHLDEAIFLYSSFLDILKANNVQDDKIYEKIYEKLAPLYLAQESVRKGIDTVLLLIDKKIALGKKGEAQSLMKSLVKNSPLDMEDYLKIVENYVKIGFLSDAFNIVEGLIQKSGANERLLKLGGEILYHLGKLEDALSYFNALLAINSDDEFSRSRVKEIEEAIHRKTESKETIQETVESNLSPPTVKEETPSNAARPTIKVSEEPVETPPPITHPIKEKIEEILHNNPDYAKALEEIKKGNEQQAIELLKEIAQKFEEEDYLISEFLYSRILVLDPSNLTIYKRLSSLYKSRERLDESIFYLEVALKHAKGERKIEILNELSALIPQDKRVKFELFTAYLEESKVKDAIDTLLTFEDNADIEKGALQLLPYISDDIQTLTTVSKFLKNKEISGKTAYPFFYNPGKAFFNKGDKEEGTKWLILAHKISKLPLEDYIMIGEYIKNMPLDVEKNIVAEALHEEVNNVQDKERKQYIMRLLTELAPKKIPYLSGYLQFLLSTETHPEEGRDILLKLVRQNPVDLAELIFNATMSLKDSLELDDLSTIATFFDLLEKNNEASAIYELILQRDPENKIAFLKFFIMNLEKESVPDIMHFLETFSPSHNYETMVNPFIEKYREIQSKNPFDYHNHFVLGFLYFLTERYEEAIASFQFVVRSHKHLAFMYYFLGLCFEWIALPDFAVVQYQNSLKLSGENNKISLSALFRLYSIYRARGNLEEARKALENILRINPELKEDQKFLETISAEKKITNNNKEEFK